MSPKLPAIAAAFVLLMAAPAAVLASAGGLGGFFPTGNLSPASDEDGDHGDDHGDQAEGMHSHGRERTEWPAAEGSIPKSPKGLVEVRTLTIEGAPDLRALAEDGVEIPGSGTLEDPYVIEGLHVLYELELKDTDDYYVITGNWFAGELRLNWNADNVHVHHNYVRDLRVNENVERTGDATGGLIELNKFGIVGQIRHFDGIFRANEVGPAPDGWFDAIVEDSGELVPWFEDRRVLNIDGFDGAIFEGNTIVGYAEMQLHGHHHASCFECHSHNHGDMEKAAMHDHSIRYHEGVFRDNVITVDEGVAFRYTDRAHAGDDRTARSEPEETLEGPHLHFTDVLIEGNTLTGGPLVVDVFNADDRYHENEERGEVEDDGELAGALTVRNNVVSFTLPDQTLRMPWFDGAVLDGIVVRDAKDARVVLEGNDVTVKDAKQGSAVGAIPLFGEPLAGPLPAGIHLRNVEVADLTLTGNSVAGTYYGVLAAYMDEGVEWLLSGNLFEDVEEEVRYDESVENKPRKG